MQLYRCYFLSADGRIASRMEFHARDDAEGLEFARELHALHVDAAGEAYGFELWQRQRLVNHEPSRAGSRAFGKRSAVERRSTVAPGESS
jgi:hypothetical protein